jgi:hypothetical protein
MRTEIGEDDDKTQKQLNICKWSNAEVPGSIADFKSKLDKVTLC